jgi:deferrochelatase/peroxidase EfeB
MSRDEKSRAGGGSEGPASPGRRGLLLGLAAAGSGAVLGALDVGDAAAGPMAAATEESSAVPFHGRHQAGITTLQQKAGLVASFAVLVDTSEELEALLRTLSQRIRFLMEGRTPAALDPKFPPSDSGVLGPKITPDRLSITLSVGASLFDERFGLAALKPHHLVTMEAFPNDALDAELCHGDLLLQICAETPEGTIHAIRDIVKHTPDTLALQWKLDGFMPTHDERGGTKKTGRNLLGFKDGTANPTPAEAASKHLIWVGGNGEPGWAGGGSYQVVRIIRNFVERWDRTLLQEQETIIGRDKRTGAPLGRARETDDPDYRSDPKGDRIPLDAHIRLANPHTKESMATRILRRPFNYSRGVSNSGQLDMGLLFICYQANLSTAFIAIQTRLNGEPLEEYIQPVGGGYFFVLPGAPTLRNYLGQSLIEAGAALSDDQQSIVPNSREG